MTKDLNLSTEDVQALINAAADAAVADVISRPDFRRTISIAVAERLSQAFAQEAMRQAYDAIKAFHDEQMVEPDEMSARIVEVVR